MKAIKDLKQEEVLWVDLSTTQWIVQGRQFIRKTVVVVMHPATSTPALADTKIPAALDPTHLTTLPPKV